MMRYVHYYMPHLILFGVCLTVLGVFLYWYWRKNPNPRFRPRAGEMAVIALIGIIIGGFASYGLGKVFRGDITFKQYEGTVDYGVGWSEGDSVPQQPDDSRYSR